MISKNPRPSQSIKRLVFVVGPLFAMALTAGIWWGEGVAENDQGEPAHWLPVNTAPLSQRIDLIGKIEPLATRILTAPYDGDVKDYLVEPGLQVESGQTLLSMDPTLLETRLREALALQLKARRTVQELRNWSTGSQVMRARRVLRSSEMQISNTQRKLSISQDLFQRGIIARDELNDLEQQSKAQQLDLAAAREELQNVLNEGSGELLQIAEMELSNATVKYEALLALEKNGEVVAPFTGVIVPASSSKNSNEDGTIQVQAGSLVTQGQALFGLANIEQFKIVSHVSELDINKLQRGQAVEIFGDGFEQRLTGVVDIVGRLALADDDPGNSARFPITLLIDKLPVEQLQHIRLGMSARLSIVIHHSEQAMVVPVSALQQVGDTTTVQFRESAEHPVQQLIVTPGRPTVEGVELFGVPSGLLRVYP